MFQGFGRPSLQAGRAALTVADGRAALAVVSDRGSARPALSAGSFAVQSEDGVADLTGVELDGYNLKRMRLSSVLPIGAYQMLLEEMPNAPDDELVKAVSWRIRDRIDTPLDEAVIELLRMPKHARAGHKPHAYAAVTHRDVIAGIVQTIRRAGYKLDAIDLPELCVSNIATRLPQDENGVAFLHFNGDHGLLTITRQGVLYLVRHFDTGQLETGSMLSTESRMALIPTVCLELQRSLDYYETQYDCRPATDLVLGPGPNSATLAMVLREQLGLNVSTLDLSELFEVGVSLDMHVQNECLLAVGAALRSDAAVRKVA